MFRKGVLNREITFVYTCKGDKERETEELCG